MQRKHNNLKLTPSMIFHRGHYLYFGWYWLYGKIEDLLLAGKALDGTIFNDSKEAFPIQSLSYPYLRKLSETVVIYPQDVFVDVGCAWGRVLGYLRKNKQARKWIGIEYNSDVAKQATQIFASSSDVEILAGDVNEVLPEDGTVFYLFNPFGETTIRMFLYQIERKVQHPIRLLYLYPTCRTQIDSRDGWELVRETQLKPRHLEPLLLCEYRYHNDKKE